MDWETAAERAEARYADGMERLPDEPDPRQRQLVRVAAAATAAGLARLMQGRKGEAAGGLVRSAERFRESFADAPPGSWGRLIGAVKARLLAGDLSGAQTDARWALDQGSGDSSSPIGRYAAVLSHLTLAEDGDAAELATGLRSEPAEVFPRPVADALAALAGHDAKAYRDALGHVLRSFEERERYLEDIPVADTVIVLEALADARGMAVHPASPLLPDR